MAIWKPRTWFSKKTVVKDDEYKIPPPKPKEVAIPSGRVSAPDPNYTFGNLSLLKDQTKKLVTPSFQTEIIPLIRDLYKINPDVGMALQDMFKLANTGHYIRFPNNSDKEEKAMIDHLKQSSKRWSTYTYGIDGLINKMITQCLVAGAISIEAVPDKSLTGISTILFIKPETIRFVREEDGRYQPYQKNPSPLGDIKQDFIKLNLATYKYSAMYNDTDEPYGVPPFMTALDSINSQHIMRNNMMNIMEKMGLVGFLQALMAKPERRANESEPAYQARLVRYLKEMKANLQEGMDDGLVTGYIDDHEFELVSTTQDLSNIEKPWQMNEQQVANGLGVNSSIIGADGGSKSDNSAGMLLSKTISQLRIIQTMVIDVLEFVYSLQLKLAGFNNKGIKVKFETTTVADDVKVQQAMEYKIRNQIALYNQGICSQDDLARAVGYDSPDKSKPREIQNNSNGLDEAAKKRKREEDKDKSDRKVRDKNNPNPPRGDQDSKPR